MKINGSFRKPQYSLYYQVETVIQSIVADFIEVLILYWNCKCFCLFILVVRELAECRVTSIFFRLEMFLSLFNSFSMLSVKVHDGNFLTLTHYYKNKS